MSAILDVASDVFPLPDKNYMTTGGYILLAVVLGGVRIILAKIKQATDLAQIAAKQLPKDLRELKEVAEEGRDEARQAKELSGPTGNGFATAIVTMIQANHIEVMGSMGRVERRVQKIEGRVEALEKDTA